MNAKTEWPQILAFDSGATITEELVDKHYRQIAKIYHPDAGGSNEAMVEVNLAKKYALEWIERERTRLKAQEYISDDYGVYAQQIARQYQQAANHYNMWNAGMAGSQSWQNAGQWANAYGKPVEEVKPEPVKRTRLQRFRDWLRAKV